METTLATGIEYTYNRTELDNMITKTIDKIVSEVKKNDYQVKGNIEEYYALEWEHFSKNQMKNIQKYCYWIDKKPSLKRINTFFSLLSRLFKIERVHVKVSLKEEQIQKARKAWLKSREETDRLLKAYKDEKGDFYKIK